MTFPWLTALALVPLVGAAVVAVLPRTWTTAPRQVALVASLLALGLGAWVALQYDGHSTARFQLSEQVWWIRPLGVHYALGLDGMGLVLVLLTVLLTPFVILASWNDAEHGRWSTNSFFAWMLATEGLAIGVFEATDVFLFYVLFEASLVPIYFLIGGFGGGDRARAATKFLIYSLVGGLVMFVAVILLYVQSAGTPGGPTYLVTDLARLHLGGDVSRWIFIAFTFGFMVKAPMVPFHTWLPDATDAATPGTSVLLVSVLDKFGTFGMVRYGVELFPGSARWAAPLMVALGAVSIIYAALLAIGATDLRRLVAYASVSHFGLMVIGIFAMNSQALAGAEFYMFNHGLSTATLFLVTGFLIARRGSADIRDFGGVERVAPVIAGMLLTSCLATLALPGMSTFVSEILVIIGAFGYSKVVGVAAVTSIVLASIYALQLYQRTMTGPTADSVRTMPDLTERERWAVIPLLILIVVLGFFPRPVLGVINPTVDHTLAHIQRQ